MSMRNGAFLANHLALEAARRPPEPWMPEPLHLPVDRPGLPPTLSDLEDNGDGGDDEDGLQGSHGRVVVIDLV